MFKSNLFTERKPQISKGLWNTQSVFPLEEMVDNLLTNQDEAKLQLKEQIAELEEGIMAVNSGLPSNERTALVNRIIESHDVYALADRMAHRLREVFQTNEELMATMASKQVEEFVSWPA